jgi:hypothetical protein
MGGVSGFLHPDAPNAMPSAKIPVNIAVIAFFMLLSLN